MDRTHDVETAGPQAQHAPPETGTPGRQPTERQGAQPTQTPTPVSGEAAGGRVTPQRFMSALAHLLAAMSLFRENALAAVDVYKRAYDVYAGILLRRSQRAQLVQQVAFQILFVGVGGAFGGMLQNVLRNFAPGVMNARRATAAPAGSAPPPLLTPNSTVVVGIGTGAGDLLKDFVKRLTPQAGGGAVGGTQPLDPADMTNLVERSLASANTHALSVMAALSSAGNEQLEADPLAVVAELTAQMQIAPEPPQRDRYVRELFERSEWVRSWRAQISAAPSESEMDRLWAHDRLFLGDIEEACPGLVRGHYQRERERVRTRRMGPERARR